MATHPLTEEQLDLLRHAGGGALLRPVQRLLEALVGRGHDAVIIGGAVRDLLLGRSPGDLDLATSATPDMVLGLAEDEGWLPIPVGKAFGVVRIRLDGAEFEVATYRSEAAYTDGRRPDLDGIEFQGSLEEDVLRRDFTMNGLALRLLDEEPAVVDLVGGAEDIRARRIRTIGDPLERFDEDALRPLRAVRFAAVLGFTIDGATAEAMIARAPGLRRVSGERIQQELTKSCVQGDARVATDILLRADLLPHLFEATDSAGLDAELLVDLVARLPRSPGLPLFLATLAVASEPGGRPGSGAAERCARMAGHLRLSRTDTSTAVEVVRGASALAGAGSLTLPRRADLYRSPHYERALSLARAVASSFGDDEAPLADLNRERAALPTARLTPPTLVTGEDLKALGMSPGPKIGELLRAVQDAQVSGEIGVREEALAWIRRKIGGEE
ncbi:MAG: hypothetical protein ABIK09_02135 [Pseudomonadota bacterium]